MKTLRRLACKFDLDQSVRNVIASARTAWKTGLGSRPGEARKWDLDQIIGIMGHFTTIFCTKTDNFF